MNFDGLIPDIVDDLPLESAVEIDVDEIDRESRSRSEEYVRKVSGLSEEYLSSHPRVRNRLSVEVETLRGLMKMLQSAERAHDAILNGISANNTNVALYRALSDTQRSFLAISSRVDECGDKIEDILNNLPEDDIPSEETSEEQGSVHRGYKDFIKDMSK